MALLAKRSCLFFVRKPQSIAVVLCQICVHLVVPFCVTLNKKNVRVSSQLYVSFPSYPKVFKKKSSVLGCLEAIDKPHCSPLGKYFIKSSTANWWNKLKKYITWIRAQTSTVTSKGDYLLQIYAKTLSQTYHCQKEKAEFFWLHSSQKNSIIDFYVYFTYKL